MTASFSPPLLLISTLLSTSSSIPASVSSKSSLRKIIKFTINLNKEIGTGYRFREWKYATKRVSFSETKDSANPESCYFDYEPGITLVDEEFFRKQVDPKISIRTMATPITV